MSLIEAKHFDIYLSYEDESSAVSLYNLLVENFSLNVWLDIKQIKTGDDRFKKTVDGINNSKIVVCCLTKLYMYSSKCKTDITLAYTNDKPIITLLLENLTIQDWGQIAFVISKAQKLNFFEEKNLWNGDLFDKLIETIEAKLGRKLHNHKIRRPFKKSRVVPVAVTDTTDKQVDKKQQRLPSIAISTAIHSVENSIQITTITTEELIQSELKETHLRQYEAEKLELKNPSVYKLSYKKIRSASLFHLLSGFNRMIFIENKAKFYATSSYNRSIITIDSNGNCTERRNPNKLLKQPWGICASSSYELFIGDNGHKCIFVFDFNLKYLRKIGQNCSNGFFDMSYDDEYGEIYIASLFDSKVIIVDGLLGRVKRQISIATPSYLKISKDFLFVLSGDYICCLHKKTFDVYQTIKLVNSDYICGLYVDSRLNVYTTAHEIDENDGKSRDVYLNIFRLSDKLILKKVNLGLTQVNDFTIQNNRLIFLSDTHFDLIELNGKLDEILKP